MNDPSEKVRTKWKRSSSLRLRRCMGCHVLVPSAGPDERRCFKCTKRLDDARARAYTPNPETEFKKFMDEWFDDELVDRRRREEKHDSERRITRRSSK